MERETVKNASTPTGTSGSRPAVSDAARRALAEAAARRAAAAEVVRPPEEGGRGGPDPVRYGDWEIKGLATDF